ncbi:MAG: N-formylglutamate amidohydrolase [Rhodobiaceae bacterium]|nr:N-formylglutamate amidohydrolase [Rhodobiaceae bacterium]MCC0015486.1 N-formylglutamate amidohydrolase [Rhodobiaceae bacterium]MCC0040948.1 N-formylglutamate amidohydrolase [Rhodobiaceae bacterium]MCC0053275.1 N-formylglutamate amidohydrolase [Rhodobiaceae bacterium]
MEDLDDGFVSHETIAGDPACGFLLLCDHARNALPARYGTLGLPHSELERHIGYDIGVEGVTRKIAARLGMPAVMTRFSRLLIDPNRGADDPTLVMRISDGAVVPGNRNADAAEIDYRKRRFYLPYDRAISEAIDAAIAAGKPPALFSIHSFTPVWRGVERPWHVGVLWDRDARLPAPMIETLREDAGLVVGDNEPYTGELEGDTMNRHGTRRGLAHALIEVRQDLITDEAGIEEWANRLSALLTRMAGVPGINEIRLPEQTGSWT